jgi:DNA-binding protein H-NS
MESNAYKSMSTDQLWSLYEQVASTLAGKIAAEKVRLEERLRKIEMASNIISLDRTRRPYPKVHPKYRNPQNSAETWSGRGKRPRWLSAQLSSGKKLHSFLIVQRSTEEHQQTG